MYLYDKNRITYFAETDRRNKRIPFGIKAEDRLRHMYIIGKTGMGKSTIIENMAVQDIKNGEGLAFIDPHGKSAALLLDYIPEERIKDVIYFAPFDMDNPVSFNVMEDVGIDKRHLVANGLMSAFKKIWGPETWSARMEYILLNVLLALLEYPNSTLLGVNRMLTDKAYRKKIVDNIKDLSVKTYWVDEFAKYSESYAKDATPAIQNKIGQFTSNPLIRNIIGQPHSSFDPRKVMDERKILIVNLSKGQMGEGNANLLGGMIITKIYLAAMSRADLPEAELKKLPNFYMYVDEFQSFANESFADILSEARKYKLSLIMAHQYIEQMDEKVRAAVFGNVGTQIMFRVGATDAEVLEKEYAPVFTAEDMVNLGFTQIYLKLMIDGVASHPFSAVTLPPIPPQVSSNRDRVIAASRELYAYKREYVEAEIAKWYGGDGQDASLTTSISSTSEQSFGERKEQSFIKQGSQYPARELKNEVIRDQKRYVVPARVSSGDKPIFIRQEGVRQGGFEKPNETEKNPVDNMRRGNERISREVDTDRRSNVVRTDNINQSASFLRHEKESSRIKEEKMFEKPFAQAFKVLAQEVKGEVGLNAEKADEDTDVNIIKKSIVGSVNSEKTVYIQQNKSVKTPENLNNLKSALADVLREEKERVVEVKKVVSSVGETRETREQVVVTEKPQRNKEEEHAPPKIKEIPEDVLMAILRGED